MVKGVNRSGQTHSHSQIKSAKKENRDMLKVTGLTTLAVRGKTLHAGTSAISLEGRVTKGRIDKKVGHAFETTIPAKTKAPKRK